MNELTSVKGKKLYRGIFFYGSTYTITPLTPDLLPLLKAKFRIILLAHSPKTGAN